VGAKIIYAGKAGEDVFLNLPFSEKEDVYVYIERGGRMWLQICGENNVCDDGVDISKKDLYKVIQNYIEDKHVWGEEL